MAFSLQQPRLIKLQQWIQELAQYDLAPQGRPPERGNLIGVGDMKQGMGSIQIANEFVAWVDSGQLDIAGFRKMLDRHGLGYDLNEPEVGLTGIPLQPLSDIWDRFCGRALIMAQPECSLLWQTPGILRWALNTTTFYTPKNDGGNTASLEKQQQWLAFNIAVHPRVREAAMLWELDYQRQSIGLDPFEGWSPHDGVSQELLMAVLEALDGENTTPPVDPTQQHALRWIEKHQPQWLLDVREAHSVYCQLQGELVYEYEWEYGIHAEALANAQSRANQVALMIAQRHAPLASTPEMELDQLFGFD